MEFNDSSVCPYCGHLILYARFEEHKSICAVQNEYSREFARSTGYVPKSVNIFDVGMYDNHGTQATFGKRIPKYHQKIRCPHCRDFYSVDEYIEHKNVCNFFICIYCEEYFPAVLMDHHELVCAQRPMLENIVLHNGAPYGTDFRFIIDLIATENGDVNQLNENNYFDLGDYRFRVNEEGRMNLISVDTENDYHRNNDTGANGFSIPVSIRYATPHLHPCISSHLREFIEHRAFSYLNQFFRSDIDHLIGEVLQALHNPIKGLAEKEIKNFEVNKYAELTSSGKDISDQCSICMVIYNAEDVVRTLKCNHFYHLNCIDTWLVQNSKCPLCKTDMKS